MNIPYEFRPEDALNFAQASGIPTKRHGDELIFSICPYCKGKSTTGQVDKYTFAINMRNGAFNCKRSSCNATGNMITLAKAFDYFSLGTTVDEYFKPRKQYRTLKKRETPIIPKEPAVKYMESRGISEAITRKYEITTQTNRDNILVFPFYDENNQMQFIKYRKTDYNKEKDRSKEWCEKGCKPILFGMNHCDLSDKRLVITEGQLDSLSVAESGITNAVSVPTGVMGFTWIPYCWDWMQNFDSIIVFGDYECGKISLLEDLAKHFRSKIMHVREEDYLDCKDANDILRKYGKEQVRKCVENAVSLPVDNVVPLSEIEAVNIYNLEKLKTGIRQLDRMMFGGLPFGGVHLITAKAGSGKSTFASQLLIQARYQGYKCFAYSGELPNYLFRAWMDFQVAGRKNVFEYENPNTGYQGYSISKINRELISAWYGDNIYLYDNSIIGGQNERKGLLKIIEKVIQQYGVRVILLDNLMTAMIMDDTKGSSEYEKQTDFVNSLRVMALKYNVMILLVAHMRKNNFAETNSNDEVAGSSNITNIAMTTLSYDRHKDLPNNKRKLRLLKNRLFGRIDTEGVEVEYDEKSKRIFGEGDDLDFDYGFDPQSDGFVTVEDEDNPFT